MVQKAILIAMLICCFAVIDVRPIKADDATAASTSSTNEKISLAKVAPELYYQLRRYPKFYGDENTVHGGLFERSFLLDNIGGARDFLVDHGIYFDMSITQYLQGNSSVLFKNIDYMVNLVGIDHVGFGSDYIPNVNITASLFQTPAGAAVFPDGGYSAAMAAKGIPTPAPYQIVAALVDKMLEKGYSETDCGKFLGANIYRVMKKVWI